MGTMPHWATYLVLLIVAFSSVVGPRPPSASAVRDVTHAEPQAPQPTLSVEQVVQLVQAGVSETVVIAKIRQNGAPFSLSAGQIIELKKAGVSDRIIRALIDPTVEERDLKSGPAPVVPQSGGVGPERLSPKAEAGRSRPAHPDPTQGSRDMEEVVDYPLERAQAAARQAMVFYGCQIKKERQGFVEGTRPRESDFWSGSGGEKVTVRLAALGDRTKVAVETGKGFVGRVWKRNWSTPIFGEMLRILQEGR